MSIGLPTPLAYQTFSTGATTLVFSGVTVAAGDTIFVYVGSSYATINTSTASDNAGNAYTAYGWNNNNENAVLLVATNVAALAGGTITVTFPSGGTGGGGGDGILASSAVGYALTADYIGTSAAFPTATAPTYTTGALSQAVELALGFTAIYPFGYTSTPSGWTPASETGRYLAMDAILTSTTSALTYAPGRGGDFVNDSVSSINVITFYIYNPAAGATTGTAAGAASVIGYTSAARNADTTGTAVGASVVQGRTDPVYIPFPVYFPPPGPTSLRSVIPSYLYVQYNDDDNLQGMVAAYNAYAQVYVDYFNALNLPIYTTDPVAGALLDWVGSNLYGIPRPTLPVKGVPSKGPLNTYSSNVLPLNTFKKGTSETVVATSDDTYRRIMTWVFFKGDGFQFDITWLKRRVARFLYGANGVNFNVDETYTISVAFTGRSEAVITVPASAEAILLQEAVLAGVLPLPFQISWSVDIA